MSATYLESDDEARRKYDPLGYWHKRAEIAEAERDALLKEPAIQELKALRAKLEVARKALENAIYRMNYDADFIGRFPFELSQAQEALQEIDK